MRVAAIDAIAHHLPDGRVTNADLAALYPGWTADKIREKTGIIDTGYNAYRSRHDCRYRECARLWLASAECDS